MWYKITNICFDKRDEVTFVECGSLEDAKDTALCMFEYGINVVKEVDKPEKWWLENEMKFLKNYIEATQKELEKLENICNKYYE